MTIKLNNMKIYDTINFPLLLYGDGEKMVKLIFLLFSLLFYVFDVKNWYNFDLVI